eukprot:TRINITY_DN4829_c1_g1_i1.p2 TRINITY_DN4829_c1_g1~~TRINITY_DN4829_c1_g1_i1.p2  ORF type:complete len:331 (+),score=68.92 TRINITY_DN4829_c1_g1_i1:445-1437(+)
MKMLTDNKHFNVIGVLGLQGVGKSQIMNHLLGKQSKDYTFALQTENDIVNTKHHTTGIDLKVTSERNILLDSQPLLSASILYDMYRTNHHLPNECSSLENLLELESLQITLFMLSVCNVVVVVNDGNAVDMNMWKLLRTAIMIKNRIPDPSSIRPNESINGILQDHRYKVQIERIQNTNDPQDLYHPDAEFIPNIVFLFNKCTPLATDIENALKFRTTLNRFFNGVPIKSQHHILLPEIIEENQTDESEEINFYMITMDKDIETVMDINISLPHNVYVDNFRFSMVSIPDEAKHNFRKPLTEKEWLWNAGKIWEIIRRSSSILEYNSIIN